MAFKLADMWAKITGLESRLAEADKTELTNFKASVTAQVDKLQSDLTEANATIASLGNDKTALNAQVAELTGKLSDANKLELDSKAALLKHLSELPGHADYKAGGAKAGATLAELITAEQNATNAAIAATGVKVDKLPAGGKAPEAANKPSNLTEACLKANKKA